MVCFPLFLLLESVPLWVVVVVMVCVGERGGEEREGGGEGGIGSPFSDLPKQNQELIDSRPFNVIGKRRSAAAPHSAGERKTPTALVLWERAAPSRKRSSSGTSLLRRTGRKASPTAWAASTFESTAVRATGLHCKCFHADAHNHGRHCSAFIASLVHSTSGRRPGASSEALRNLLGELHARTTTP